MLVMRVGGLRQGRVCILRRMGIQDLFRIHIGHLDLLGVRLRMAMRTRVIGKGRGCVGRRLAQNVVIGRPLGTVEITGGRQV